MNSIEINTQLKSVQNRLARRRSLKQLLTECENDTFITTSYTILVCWILVEQKLRIEHSGVNPVLAVTAPVGVICVVFFGKIPNSHIANLVPRGPWERGCHIASLQLRVSMGTDDFSAGEGGGEGN